LFFTESAPKTPHDAGDLIVTDPGLDLVELVERPAG
jgi:hypothetical protein